MGITNHEDYPLLPVWLKYEGDNYPARGGSLTNQKMTINNSNLLIIAFLTFTIAIGIARISDSGIKIISTTNLSIRFMKFNIFPYKN